MLVADSTTAVLKHVRADGEGEVVTVSSLVGSRASAETAVRTRSRKDAITGKFVSYRINIYMFSEAVRLCVCARVLHSGKIRDHGQVHL